MNKRKQITKQINRIDYVWEALFYLVLAGSMLALIILQPFGDPPDEINRFKVAYYVYKHGTIPIGSEPEILLAGYGASYAFQPILTYILEGYLMRFLSLFTENSYVMIVASRMVNMIFGLLMAYYVRKISKTIWSEKRFQWLFSVFVMFLPQNLFMHTYINTDSMALLSCAMITYAMLLGEERNYDKNSCILMGIGVVLCAMSYYNAYGIVLVAILFWGYHFIKNKDVKQMRNSFLIIAAIGFAGAGWWFIRNGILYQGDILGMTARRECAMETALPDFNPLTRFTYLGAGIPLLQMFRETEFVWLSFESFYAMFGPMQIPTHGLIYIYFKKLVILAFLCLLIPVKSAPAYWKDKAISTRVMFGCAMLLDILITIGLHIYYSYTWEYQPQGRYALPMIIGFMYFMILGIWKINELVKWIGTKIKAESAARILLFCNQLAVIGVIAVYLLWFAYTIGIRVLPVYINGENLMTLQTMDFSSIIPK